MFNNHQKSSQLNQTLPSPKSTAHLVAAKISSNLPFSDFPSLRGLSNEIEIHTSYFNIGAKKSSSYHVIAQVPSSAPHSLWHGSSWLTGSSWVHGSGRSGQTGRVCSWTHSHVVYSSRKNPTSALGFCIF